MKFRTKIWTLPLSAAAVFVVGVIVSFVVGSRTSSVLDQLGKVDSPYLNQVVTLDRSTEQLRLTLQSAVAEGDAAKLKDVDPMIASAREAVAAIGRIDGKGDQARDLGAAFDAYQNDALAAVRAMLEKTGGDSATLVAKMQASQTAITNLLAEQNRVARATIEERQRSANAGVHANLWVTVVTGAVVLVVLGLASWLILNSVWKDLGGEPAELREALQRVAEGDLGAELNLGEAGDGSLRGALVSMVSRMRETVRTIRHATDSIGTASNEIASGNQDLSQRTEHTASNLQQTASSMEQLTGTVLQSADAARQANQLASSAAEAAQRGGGIVSQVVVSMSEINNASRKINEIIGVIDGIAFQTNILALNAAVEAARAGEQGRGFAVVAGEVRNLAQRSAQAAKEIKTLINASSEKVESGAKLVEDAGTAMKEIVSGVQRVTDIIGEITAAAAEQSAGIGSVNNAVSQLDQMTQQNAALVEQSAAAAESLKEQAAKLAEAVAAFRLSGAGGSFGLSGFGGASGGGAAAPYAAPSSMAPTTPASLSPLPVSPSAPSPSAAAGFTASAASSATPPVVRASAVAPATPPASGKPVSGGNDSDWETF